MFNIKYPFKRFAALILSLLVFAAYSLPSGAGNTADVFGGSNEPFNFFTKISGESDDFTRDAIKIINANWDDAYFMTIRMEPGKNELDIDGKPINIGLSASLDANGEVMLPIGEILEAIDLAAADNASVFAAAPAGSADAGPAPSSAADASREIKKSAAVMSADGAVSIISEGEPGGGATRFKGVTASAAASAASASTSKAAAANTSAPKTAPAAISAPASASSPATCSASEAEKKYGLDVSLREGNIIISKPFQLKQLILYMKDGRGLTSFCGASDYATNGKGAYFLQFPDENAARAAYKAYAVDARVQYVAANHMVRSCALRDRLGAEIVYADSFIEYLDANEKTGEPLIVAVIDTGVDVTHEHLAGRTAPGWNFDGESGDPYDKNGHGTHVSGIIADCTPANVKIIPVKALNDQGEAKDAFILSASIAWAAENAAKIINMSLGGYCVEEYCINLQAVDYALEKGALSVVAAGNDTDDASHYCPASSFNAVTVAATVCDDTIAGFSNYGDCVDIAAPGVSIFSSLPGNEYGYYSGTSMSTPYVSAGAAMLMLEYPDYTPLEIKEKLKTLTYSFNNRYWLNYGAGILDFYGFFHDAALPGVRMFNKNISINSIPAKYELYHIWARVMPAVVEDRSLTFSSDNSGVAVCDENYDVRITGNGTANIIATSNAHGATSSFSVTVDVDESMYWISRAAESFAGGDGGRNDPFIISTPEELALLAKKGWTRGGFGVHFFENVYVELANDIDLSGLEWLSVGGCFNGYFDGKGHVIRNMRQSAAYENMSMYNNGLFGFIVMAEVMNLGIVDAYVDNPVYRTGIFAADAAGCTVSNCYTTGYSSDAALIGFTGGIILISMGSGVTGYAQGYVNNCYSTANAKSLFDNTNSPVINNCYYKGDGYFAEQSYSFMSPELGGIYNCFLDTPGPEAGYFINKKSDIGVYNCYYSDNGNAGVCEDYNPWDTDLRARPPEFFLDAGNYSDAGNWYPLYPWDFEYTWGMDENINGGLPYLLFKEPPQEDQAGAPYFQVTDALFGKKLSMYSTTAKADIYYTTDGSEPDRSSAKYYGELWFQGPWTYVINAFAVRRGMADSQATGITFTIDPTETPVADTAPGLVNRGAAVALSSATPGAAIYYTTDGSYPYEKSAVYTKPIIINEDTFIIAVACKPGNAPSAPAELAYYVVQPQRAAPPWFSVFDAIDGKDIYLRTATEGADIYYTLDGSDPAVSGEIYADCIKIRETESIVIKAIAVKEGLKPSQIANFAIAPAPGE